MASLTGTEPHSLQIKTDFLKAGEKYEAKIYSFNPESESSTKVEIEKKEVNSESKLSFEILKNSGLAIHFKKLD